VTDPNLVGYPADGAVLGSAWHFVIFCCVMLCQSIFGGSFSWLWLWPWCIRNRLLASSAYGMCPPQQHFGLWQTGGRWNPSQPNDEKLAPCLGGVAPARFVFTTSDLSAYEDEWGSQLPLHS
jgi:hypothetical protein